MKDKTRNSGIEAIGELPSGAHICQFYRTKKDLFEILVPYFKAGLENNEFCLWVTSESLHIGEAKTALKKVVNNLDGYLANGQMEVLDYGELYTEFENFDIERVLETWANKEKQAAGRGFAGFRSGIVFSHPEIEVWKNSTTYQSKLKDVVSNYKAMFVCSYPLDKCGISDIVNAAYNHNFTLVKRMGQWNTMRNSDHNVVEKALRQTEEKYYKLIKNIPDVIWTATIEGNMLFISPNIEMMMGYTPDEIYKQDFPEWRKKLHPDDEWRRIKAFKMLKEEGARIDFEVRFKRKDGEWRWLHARAVSSYEKDGVQRIDGLTSDITERKQTEKEKERLLKEVRSTNKQLQTLSRKLLEVQENERRYIGRELHDEVGQILTGLRLALETAMRTPPELINDQLVKAHLLTGELITQVRELSLKLRPSVLDDLGLLPALLWYIQRYETQTNIKVDFKHAGLRVRPAPEVETAAYRIIQEGLTNIARHANVNSAVVILMSNRKSLHLHIEDWGTGFDRDVASMATSGGLIGMQERAILVGGYLTVDSALGSGTRITARLPIKGLSTKKKL